ncbi:MAG: hypothetical protein HYZ48_02120 [Chlamydiales bacterium]|nr:hypothetical protein [Chlamydiales bacterium]
MKRSPILTSLLALTVCGLQLNAATDARSSEAELSQQALFAEQLISAAPKEKNKETTQQREITPQAGPKMTRCVDPYISMDFIYWSAVQDGLQYSYNGVPNSVKSAKHARINTPDFDCEPGLKVGFGLKVGHDGWDVFANYTWLSEFEDTNSVEAKSGYRLGTVWQTSLIPGAIGSTPESTTSIFCNRSHIDWRMQFNALDLELGRNFYISNNITLRPHIGFKFGWISQHYHIKYKGFSYGSSDGTDTGRYTIRNKQEFFGAGLRGGIDTVWYFVKHFGFYGDLSISTLWSDFHVHRKDSVSDPVGDVVIPSKIHNLRLKDSIHNLTEVLELGFGMRYDTTFFEGDYQFSFQAGWEQQIWFDQNQFFDLTETLNGNLSLQGLTIKAGLMF